MLFSRCRLAAVASLCGILGLLLSACNLPMQSDPPGQNSGSPQYAQGAFNTDDPHAVSGAVGQSIAVYNIYTTITTSITVTSANVTTATANKNASTQVLPAGEQFLTMNLTLKNLSQGDTSTCPLNICTEYISPLSNFRLFDPNGRNWPTSTGAEENCAPLSDTCNSRQWITEATHGIAAGATFTAALNFVIPTSVHTFTLFYAAYRFNDTTTDTGVGSGTTSGTGASLTPAPGSSTTPVTTPAATGTGTPTGTPVAPAPSASPAPSINQPTLAKIVINV